MLAVAACDDGEPKERAPLLEIYDFEAHLAGPSQGFRALERRPDVSGNLIVVRCDVIRGNCLHTPKAKWAYYVLRRGPELTRADVARQSARAALDPHTGEPVVLLQFTERGRSRFHNLTRRLAQRGRRTGMPQHLAIVVKREIAALAFIDFEHYPGGIRGDSGVQLNLPSLREARELARNLNAP